MGVIGINELLFPVTITKMKNAGNAINGKIKKWESQGESAKAFKRYVENYEILQNILKDYKKMIANDIKAINKIGTEIKKSEAKAAGYWRKK